MGVLSVAFVAEACGKSEKPQSIDVAAYEVDDQLADLLEVNLDQCFDLCKAVGIEFKWQVIRDDYVLRSAEPLLNDPLNFNCAILNPPYGKVNAKSEWRAALRSLSIETVNLYTAFVAVAMRQLSNVRRHIKWDIRAV